jgi:hypothetical protein
MRKAFVLFFVSLFVSVIALTACGGDRGDDCDEEGVVIGECDDGLVCGKSKADGSGDLICLRQCDTQLNCGDGEECGAVGKTSLKACRPR